MLGPGAPRDGPLLYCDQRIHFGGGHESTWLTPNGPAYGVIEGRMYGLSMGVAKFVLDGLVVPQFVCITPVDMETSMIFSTTTANIDPAHPNKPGGRAKMMMKAQIAQLENDFEIWSHQRYVERPPFVGSEERGYARLRRWSRQFYPDAGPLEAIEDVLTEAALGDR